MNVQENKKQSKKNDDMKNNLLSVLKALSDPTRLYIIKTLIGDEPGVPRHCTTFNLTLSKPTISHHFKILRNAGLINQYDNGNHSTTMLRRDEIEKQYPGLLDILSKSE
ncbi:helix-turn-helix transcriptional regulator [Frischella sp. Ac48]|uniref:Helix-turn-helix transcriptional regulator n=1 Tax=Frischella japonica TaxID=2741544 RepID=A0ABR7QUI9_9GAMM|nr:MULTISPECIES: ArsR family transcriptional regulator [Frischella]MBC9129866.1 helix-turn-helix transcriptional regulator [Frischella japonica]MBX4132856.1 helix-turn-helix transcriptional regulator [Frischella sp. Ac48]